MLAPLLLAAAAVLVWSGSGASHLGAPSPDGRYLSGVHPESGQLLIRDAESGILRRLGRKTAPQEHAGHSVFSADGSLVAYAWLDAEGRHELRVASVDTFIERTLLVPDGDKVVVQPWGFTPDSKQILTLLIRGPQASEIALVSVETGAVKVVKRLRGSPPARLSLAPDGRLIAYRNSSLTLDGSREDQLVDSRGPNVDLSPVFSADGRSIFFLAGDGALWRTGLDARLKPALVQAGVGRVFLLGATREGRIYLGLRAGVGNVFRAALDAASGRLTSEPEPIGESEPQTGLGVAAGGYHARGKELWRDGGDAPVEAFPRDITALAVASDGLTVAVAQSTTLTVLSPKGRVESRAASETISGLVWTADGHSLITVQNDSLWWWSASLDSFRRLVKVQGAIGSVRLETADSAVTFTAGRPRSEVWSIAVDAR